LSSEVLPSVVLLSGGLDSAVNLKCAVDRGKVKMALTFDYGQGAFENEEHAARACADLCGVPHEVVSLDWYRRLLPAAMTGDAGLHAYRGGLVSDTREMLDEAWVPNRNCVFAAIGAAYAEKTGAGRVVMGFNRDEAEVFPDNSASFVERMNCVLKVSTLSDIALVTYTQDLSKEEMVRLGMEIGAPLDAVYSCYKASSDQTMCGSCQSCVRLKRAFEANGLMDRFASRFAA
jgi:7-cyano-7-deazaguanine synthase